MTFELAVQEFDNLFRDVKVARSPSVYPEDSKVNSLFRNAKNLIQTYAPLLQQDFTKDLTAASNARGNGYYKLEHLELFLEDAIKQLKRVQKLSEAKVSIPSIGNSLTAEIQKYLRQSGEADAAAFLNDCVIENYWKDLVSSDNDDYDRELFDVTVFVPVGRYKKLDTASEKIQSIIDSAVREYAYSSGRLVNKLNWQPYLLDEDEEKLDAKTVDLNKLLNDSMYVSSKIQILKDSLEKTPHLAIGTAKELVEICCKAILNHHKIETDSSWELPRLVKEMNKVLSFKVDASDEKLQQSIKLITGGLANVIHGIAEIRNRFGSGHGHSINFKELNKAYTHLAVFSSIEFITFYLRIFHTNGKLSN